MDYFIICFTSLAVSGLTLFSGFGLGTVLAPVMAIFFPIEAAVAMTAVVHFANNLFKLAMFGRAANLQVVIRFGIPALLTSLAGAWILVRVSDMEPIFRYFLLGHQMEVSPVKLLVGMLVAFFAVLEFRTKKGSKPYPPSWLPVGGVVSGFFGGLSGNQGAFRSAFLLGAGLSKEAFIATGVVLACLVDASRLTVYAGLAGTEMVPGNLGLIITATLSAFLGAFIGARVLKKITITTVRILVGIMLLGLAAALCLGVI